MNAARPATSPPDATALDVPPPSAVKFSSLGIDPLVVDSARVCSSPHKQRQTRSLPVPWARDLADAEKITNARKAYMATCVKRPPRVSLEALPGSVDPSVKLSSMENVQVRCMTAPALNKPGGKYSKAQQSLEFSPMRSFDFFTQAKGLAMWKHYDVGGLSF